MNKIKQKNPVVISSILIVYTFLIITSFLSVAFLCSSGPDVSNQREENNEGTEGGIIASLLHSFSFMESDLKQMELANDR